MGFTKDYWPQLQWQLRLFHISYFIPSTPHLPVTPIPSSVCVGVCVCVGVGVGVGVGVLPAHFASQSTSKLFSFASFFYIYDFKSFFMCVFLLFFLCV